MTPFGWRLRELRRGQGKRLKDMAASLGVSAAYLSALEHGHRGRPGGGFPAFEHCVTNGGRVLNGHDAVSYLTLVIVNSRCPLGLVLVTMRRLAQSDGMTLTTGVAG